MEKIETSILTLIITSNALRTRNACVCVCVNRCEFGGEENEDRVENHDTQCSPSKLSPGADGWPSS